MTSSTSNIKVDRKDGEVAGMVRNHQYVYAQKPLVTSSGGNYAFGVSMTMYLGDPKDKNALRGVLTKVGGKSKGTQADLGTAEEYQTVCSKCHGQCCSGGSYSMCGWTQF